jgi:hypothetical protein
MRFCGYSECTAEFQPKTHNQRYCSDEHCRLATNARIMENYYRKKARRAGQERMCAEGCGTKLSRYNDSDVCNGCMAKRTTSVRISLLDMVNNNSVAC